jgi:hypothetical protein
MRNTYKILVGKSQGERLFGKLRLRLEDNTKKVLEGMECELDSTGSGEASILVLYGQDNNWVPQTQKKNS